jgi:hypothetical protein
VYGEVTSACSAVFKWHKCSAQGKGRLEDDEHTSQLRMARTELKIQKVAKLVHTNCCFTADEVTAAGISHGTCHKILSDDLNISHVTQHIVPCILMQDKCDDCMSTCGDLINSADKDGAFLNRIITGNETWCFLYDLQMKGVSVT